MFVVLNNLPFFESIIVKKKYFKKYNKYFNSIINSFFYIR